MRDWAVRDNAEVKHCLVFKVGVLLEVFMAVAVEAQELCTTKDKRKMNDTETSSDLLS